MSRARHLLALVLLGAAMLFVPLFTAGPASATTTSSAVVVAAPAAHAPAAASAARPAAQAVSDTLARPAAPPTPPSPPATPESPTGGITVNVDSGGRSQVVTIIVLMTVLSIAPSILLLMTSFTKIAVVLALTRQAMGTPTIPPNQVIAGVALFLSLFVMGPVIGQVNEQAVQPYTKGSITMTEAFERGEAPLRTFMLKQTGKDELQAMVTMSGQQQPADPKDVEFTTLVPAFVLSELKTAFIIGFVIFVPFLVIDLVVASVLMAMGMMMLPPIMISMPFKILLFIMVDGWSLITTALVSGYMGT